MRVEIPGRRARLAPNPWGNESAASMLNDAEIQMFRLSIEPWRASQEKQPQNASKLLLNPLRDGQYRQDAQRLRSRAKSDERRSFATAIERQIRATTQWRQSSWECG